MTRDEIVVELEYDRKLWANHKALHITIEILKLLPVKPDGTVDTDAIVGYGTGTGPRNET